MVLSTCERFSDRLLLRDDTVSLTGEATAARIREIGRALEDLAPEGARVGVLFYNSVGRALAILAILGAKRVPVIFDCGEPYRQFTSDPESLKLSALITSARDFSDVPRFTGTIFLQDDAIASVEGAGREFAPPPPGTGLILYTSGSTGERKGVRVPWAGIRYTVDYLIDYFGLDTTTRASLVLPLCHSMGLNTQFLPTFFAGGRCDFIEVSHTLNRVYRALLATESTFVSLIGELLLICSEERARRDLPAANGVRHVQLAGGTIRSEHLALARDLFPNAVIHKGYGLTEAIRVSMISSRDPAFDGDNAGYLLPEQRAEIRGEPGELFVKGPNVMLGYDNVAENPVGADGFLATGDLAHFDDAGRLIVAGRGGSVFKVAGSWVSAVEIERTVAECLTSVRDVKCLPVPDRHFGNRVVLFLERGAGDFTAEKKVLETALCERFPRVTRPRDVFVLDKFPRTANGKLQSHVLAGHLARAAESERNGGFRYWEV